MHLNDKQVDTKDSKFVKMGFKDWVSVFFGCCILLAIICILIYVLRPMLNPEYNQIASYQDCSDIVVSHETETAFARISIKDRFRRDDTDYFIFTTSITGDTEYTFSEEQYEAAFGLSNNAFDCQYYTLTLTAPVVQYKHGWYEDSYVVYFDLDELPVYEPYAPYFNDNLYNMDIPESLFDAASEDLSGCYQKNYYQKDVEKEVVIKKLCPKEVDSTHSLSCEIKLTRYSFLGEEDFTAEEIESYKGELDDLSSFVLDSFYDSF